MERIATSKRTKAILQKYGIQLKKSLGQHFMADGHILMQMVQGISTESGDLAVEIGPGIGALTQVLAENFDRVVAVEIDQRLVPVLRELFEPVPSVQVVEADFLAVDLVDFHKNHLQDANRIHVIANLPYYITSAILMKILESELPWQTMTVMIQKEVADRLVAKPGSKTYGSLTVAAQYYAEIHSVCRVPATAFVPPPNVESAVIRFTRRSNAPAEINEPQRFFDIVRLAFTHRRKTILNNLLPAKQQFVVADMDREQFAAWLKAVPGIDPSARAESLSIAQFAQLSNQLFKR